MIKQAIYLLFIFLFLSVNSCSKDHGKNNGMADSDRDAYWSHPKKSFEKRRQLYLDYSAARPVTSNKAPFPQIARLELDLPIEVERQDRSDATQEEGQEAQQDVESQEGHDAQHGDHQMESKILCFRPGRCRPAGTEYAL